MVSYVGHLYKHLFSIIADSFCSSKYVGEGILFCAWGFGIFCMWVEKGEEVLQKKKQKRKFLLQTNCL